VNRLRRRTADAARAPGIGQPAGGGRPAPPHAGPNPSSPTEEPEEQRVTPLELFFDLVFVFAITQVTGFVDAAPSWTRLAEGLAILAVLWMSWCGYAWLGNAANSDDGLARLTLLSAMGATLIVSLAVPHAFDRDGWIFGVAYFALRALHIGAYVALARTQDDAPLRQAILRLGGTELPAAALLIVAAAFDGAPRAALWIAALLVDYGLGALLTMRAPSGVAGWHVEPRHLAERYNGFVIIALGESVVSVGVGVAGVPLDISVVGAALLGLGTAAALWWAHFDLLAIMAAQRLRGAPLRQQVEIARDVYTLLHLPLVGGIVVFAMGLRRTLLDVDARLDVVPAVALLGGVALYLLALTAVKWRSLGSIRLLRPLTAVGILAILPAALAVPALAALGMVTAGAWLPIAVELIRQPDARRRARLEAMSPSPVARDTTFDGAPRPR
jgi:low temperature requirement protein LtrA